MSWCKQCKHKKPESAFYQIRRRRWKVTICWDCAGENMQRYVRTEHVGRLPKDVTEALD